MPIKNIDQPKIIQIDDALRLRCFDNKYDFAWQWYQDLELVKLVDGQNATLYTYNKLKNMYEYLNNNGELYFIEILEGNNFKPIGDVTLCKDDLPIVIGDKNYHKKGIGKKVLLSLIQRAKKLNFSSLNVREIYQYNIASQNLFKSVGFIEGKTTKNGKSYFLDLK
ncbi:Uncharacterised protein [uncultured Clostridium sp.]|nr:Uncharacterised protein [uncultured Clostridium sp.]SCI82554.1 Uncharacterised protein [uncultured Clostridium sp.]